MVYLLKDSNLNIVGFSDNSFSLSENQTQIEDVNYTMIEYSQLFFLSADKQIILADGLDVATVTLTTSENPAPLSIDVSVNGVQHTVSLIGNTGTILINANISGIIHIEPWDKTIYSPSGNGSLNITAE